MIARPPIASILLVLVSSPLLASAQGANASPMAARIDAYLAAHEALGQFSGTALVAEEGEVVYRGAFGLANEDWGIANELDSKFRLASVTKQFTALLVLQLVEEGLLELDAPITAYLPDYPAESGGKVTLHHLLNHTSGIPSYTDRPDYFQKDVTVHYAVDEFVAEFCSDPLEFEPGTAFHYNNSGYFLLGAIVEAVTNQTYRKALRQRVFDPLGMQDTGYDDQNAILPHRATGYDELLGKRRLARWMDMSTPYAAGALYSTVDDLWKWEQALRAHSLLSEELQERMFTSSTEGYGYGWFVHGAVRGTGADTLVTWHTGRMPGVATSITRVPARGRCIVLLCNTSHSAIDEAVRGVLGILDGNAPSEPELPAERSLALSILDGGVALGLERLASMPSSFHGDRLEQEFNGMGYGLLGQERFEEALLLLEFNTRAFPESSNAWDSLGEVHLAAGNHQRALESYRKARELDPASARARDAVEKLELLVIDE